MVGVDRTDGVWSGHKAMVAGQSGEGSFGRGSGSLVGEGERVGGWKEKGEKRFMKV